MRRQRLPLREIAARAPAVEGVEQPIADEVARRATDASRCRCSGGNVQPGFEGGQMPLQRRLPKRGFHNPFRVQMSVVNLAQLEALSENEVTPESMAQHGLIAGKGRRVKVLGDGALTRPLSVKAHGFSAAAKEKIEAAGGKVELIPLHA